MYQELRGWQTGLGSLLGFIALMSAALWNFHLNRIRDSRLRADEVRSIAAALYGEIILLREEIASLARIVAKLESRAERARVDAHFIKSHPLPEPILYPALASKIGMLDSKLVLAVTEFYRNLQHVKTALPLLVEDVGRTYNFSSLVLLEPASRAVNNINPALRSIESLCKISTSVETPDLGMTEDIVESELQLFNPPK